MHFSASFRHTARIAGACAAALLLPMTGHAITAGDPNPGTDIHGSPYPADSIVGHTLNNTNALPFGGIGDINGGTGVLLDRFHVLTAAHLFDGSGTNPSGIFFRLNTGGSDSQLDPAAGITINPGYVSPFDHPNVNQNDSGDLAIVTLSQPAQADAPTYSLYTGPITLGSTVFTLVGYGAAGYGTETTFDVRDDAHTKRFGENTPDAFLQPDGMTITPSNAGSPADPSGQGVFLFGMPTPDGKPGPLGGVTLGNTVESTIGVGDSGSPAFVFMNGQYMVAGINAFTFNYQVRDGSGMLVDGPMSPSFNSIAGGSLVAPYAAFIGSLVPAPEPSCWAVLGTGAFGLCALRRRRV